MRRKMAELGKSKKGAEVDGDEKKDGDAPQTVLYVVGAIAHGKICEDWAEERMCVSEYPLSASTVCARITIRL